MKQREEGAKYKYLAAVNPKLCVGCGICIGACDPLALSLHNRPVEWLWDEVVARAGIRSEGQPVKLLFTCERHWSQRPAEMGSAVAVIPLTCVGMALPDLVERGLAAGAAEVQIVGCPPEDCTNREGNLWLPAPAGAHTPAEVGPGVRRCADHHRLAASERFSQGFGTRRHTKPRPRAMI